MNVTLQTMLWFIAQRLIAATFLVAFASLHHDVLGLAGERGIYPIQELVRAYKRDFGWRRQLYAPSYLHWFASDRGLRFGVYAGLVASLYALFALPYAPVAILIAWLLFLSFDLAVDLHYPWDSVLLELGFLSLLLALHGGFHTELPARLPVLLPVPVLLPAPLPTLPNELLFLYKWLAFRVLFGFGKMKFLSEGKLHTGYLAHFMITQPIPTSVGLAALRLPLWIHKAALGFLFVVEVLLPWLWLIPGLPLWCAPVASFACIALMLGIALTGNFGFFNLIVVPLALIAMIPYGNVHTSPAITVFACCLTALSVMDLPFNSWVSRSWMYWPAFERMHRGWGRGLRAIVRLRRAFAPFRLVHAYGVFGKESGPPVQWLPVLEGSLDGQTWWRYRTKFYPGGSDFAGRWVAPFFPRFDHSLIYEAMGLGLGNLFSSVVGGGRPHKATRAL